MDDFARILAELASKLQAAIRSDVGLRSDLRELGRLLLSLTETTADTEKTQAVAAEEGTAERTPAEPEPPADRLTDLDPSQIQIGSLAPQASSTTPTITGTAPARPKTEDLPLIEKRCSLKAEASRWAARRQKLLSEGADFLTDIEPQDKDVISRARAIDNCFLWMCHRASCPAVQDGSQVEDLAAIYDVTASAVQLLRRLLAHREDAEELLDSAIHCAVEAQSMLRFAVKAIGYTVDLDQAELFRFLRALTFDEQILITSYMKSDDPADPSHWNDLLDRIESLDDRFEEIHGSKKRRRSCYNRIRYHLKKVDGQPDEQHHHDWQNIMNEVDLLVREGLPPSNIDLRDLLVDLIDEIPKSVEIPAGAQLVIREIDRYLSSRPVQHDEPPGERPSAAVQRVAALLGGRAILMIGGENRPYAKKKLQDAFSLSELIWLKTSEQTPRLDCEAEVSHPDVALILLAIRWSRHSFDDVKELCDKHGKPLVRLPAGYNPNQVAEQILRQSSERLAAMEH